MPSPPNVLQLANVRIGGSYRPMMSGSIVNIATARSIIAANHARAISLGYTSVLDTVNNNRVTFTDTADVPNVAIDQWFVPFGHRYWNPRQPVTGQFINEVGALPPNALGTPVAAPPIGSSLEPATDIVAVFGQSNADGSGEGRYCAQVSVTGGHGGFAWNDNYHAFQSLADPIGVAAAESGLPGATGHGYNAGPWCRLCERAYGKIIPETGAALNRLIIFSGAVAGTPIEYWAVPSLYADNLTGTQSFTTGSKTFQASTASLFKFPYGGLRRITAASGDPAVQFMDCRITGYNATTGMLTVEVTAVNAGATGAPSSWTIAPVQAGVGYSATQAHLQSMIDHGIPPRRVVFIQGESNNGRPPSWSLRQGVEDAWESGFFAWSNIVVATMAPTGFVPPIYVARSTACFGRTPDDQAVIDALADAHPDVYVATAKGMEAIRTAQWKQVNTLTGPTARKIRKGVDLDLFGPDCRVDGCHVGNRGLDLEAEQWADIFYGSHN